VIESPSSFSASASAIQSRRHVRNLKLAEKRYDISRDAYRSVSGFEAWSCFTGELYVGALNLQLVLRWGQSEGVEAEPRRASSASGLKARLTFAPFGWHRSYAGRAVPALAGRRK
jgi:hypothetical protein